MRKLLLAILSAAVIHGFAPATVYFVTADQAEARGGGGHRGGGRGGGGRHTVNKRPAGGQHAGGHRPGAGQRPGAGNRPAPGNRPAGGGHNNVDINVDRNTNINVDRGYYDRNHHPVAAAAAVTATALAIGTIVASIPSGCVEVDINGILYQQCGDVWYAPRYQGTTVNYVVVNPPR